jgi:nucleoid DNA-binding protein
MALVRNKDLAHQLMMNRGTLSREECEGFVNEIVEIIKDNLLKGNRVSLKGIGFLGKKTRIPLIPPKPLKRKDGKPVKFNEVLNVIYFKQAVDIKKEINGKL